jgi:acyl-CoA thioesterase
VRLTERDGLDPMIELVAIADCLPPAALKLVGGPAPVSSMTWQLNLLGPTPRTRDGWWLLRAAADYAKDGSSSQSMGIWNTDGTPVAEQVQSVAIFA